MNDEIEETLQRLHEILNEIENLIDEADDLVKEATISDDVIYLRANAYWIPHIKNMLRSEYEPCTLETTIDDIKDQNYETEA